MQRITSYLLLAVGALVAPLAVRAQAPKAPIPEATVRELATIEGNVSDFVRLPNGRIVIYRVDDGTFVYDVTTKRRTLLGTDMLPASVSPQGDRFAFLRLSEDRTGRFVWTMPIDPRTGIATGEAQRVSLHAESGKLAAFSPDGGTIAYFAGPLPDGTCNLTLVPATGGPERVVAHYPDTVRSAGWREDGKWLYVETEGATVIERVPVAGGPSERLFPHTALTGHWAVGLSPDARVAIFQDNPNRFYYRTASGEEGEIPVSLPPLDDGWGYDFTLESMRYATITQVHHERVRILDVATGQARDLLPGSLATMAPAWSPDGRRIAVLIGNLSHYEIAIMNADGSGLRRYPLPAQLDGWGDPHTSWSPDAHFLAFRARDRRVFGFTDQASHLVLLDVTSGETRVLANASPGFFDNLVWRSDGKAIRVLKARKNGGPGGHGTVVDIALDGTERVVRDITAELHTANDLSFISDREAVVTTARTDAGIARYVVPLDGGAARRLPDSGLKSGTERWMIDGDRLFIHDSHETRVTILSTAGDATRTLRLPFGDTRGAAYPGGTQVLYVGQVTGDSLWTIFLVPLDGSAPRALGEIPGGTTGGSIVASPDGKLIAYTSEGTHTSTLLEVDFGPALKAILKR
jgi:Tol biopolymer transport system component